MKSQSNETESETVEDLLDDEELEPEFELDFAEKLAIRQWAILQSMEYWDKRVDFEAESSADATYPQHISTILDTAFYIEKFLMGDFKGV